MFPVGGEAVHCNCRWFRALDLLFTLVTGACHCMISIFSSFKFPSCLIRYSLIYHSVHKNMLYVICAPRRKLRLLFDSSICIIHKNSLEKKDIPSTLLEWHNSSEKLRDSFIVFSPFHVAFFYWWSVILHREVILVSKVDFIWRLFY